MVQLVTIFTDHFFEFSKLNDFQHFLPCSVGRLETTLWPTGWETLDYSMHETKQR